MNIDRIFSIRWKLLLAALLSGLFTATILFVVYTLSTSLIEREPFSRFIKWGINHIGSSIILALFGAALFVGSYMLLTQSVVKSLLSLQQSLKSIGDGNFELSEPILSRDELSALSAAVSDSVHELNSYIDEIIEGLSLMAAGQLDHRIAVKERHKLSKVASHINEMAEQLSRSIQEERLAEKSKNDLITGVSHDLRTPLTSILGFLEVIKQYRYRDEVEMMHYVDIAYSKAEHLKVLIDDLFQYTRMNNGMPIKTEPLYLDDFLQQLMEEYVPIMSTVHIQGRLIIEQSRVQISADGELLVRAIGNILQNALRYGKDGKYVDVTLRLDATDALVIIANYGNPIPASDLPFIFERFYRIDKSRSLEGGGTGLGLAITRSIIELHQGTISVESDIHRTAFKISFPLLSN